MTSQPKQARAKLLVAALALGVSACAAPGTDPFAPPVLGTAPIPPAVPPDAVVGRWGLASYHREEDRARTETAARNGCRQPYVIAKGPSGGVVMHLADQSQPEELALKGAPGGRTFIGPAGEAGMQQDREIVHFDGKLMTLRWMDAEVAGRYGTMVYARCEDTRPTAARPPASRPAPARKGP